MTDHISSTYVPPHGPDDAKILFVGEAPGEVEEEKGMPFCGPAGQRLRNTIFESGYNPELCRYANLCNYRPDYNKFYFLYRSTELADGQNKLRFWIQDHKPNVVVPLGNEALQFLTGKRGINTWRGSIIPFLYEPTIKCIPTLHPSFVERDQTNIPAFALDIARIIADSSFPEFRYTDRQYIINPTGEKLVEWTEFLCKQPKLGTDIESSKKDKKIICVGFAPTPYLAVCIYTDTLEGRIAIGKILESPAEKIFHFGIFDNLMLRREGFKIVNYRHDTYIGQRIFAPDQPNSLGYLTSIHTREPYYKTEGRSEIPGDTKVWSERTDRNSLGIYNSKDCCVTIEAHISQIREIEEDGLLPLYENHMEQQLMAIDISEAGVLIDEERRLLFQKALLKKWQKKQEALNVLCNEVVNVSSPKQIKRILYSRDHLGLPERKKRDSKTGEWKTTTDEDALVASVTYCLSEQNKLTRDDARKRWNTPIWVCKLIIQIRGVRKLLSTYIGIKGDPKNDVKYLYGSDYRIRSTYKVCGAETLRYSAEMFVDESGVNGQTFPREGLEIPEDLETDTTLYSFLLTQETEEREEADFTEKETA